MNEDEGEYVDGRMGAIAGQREAERAEKARAARQPAPIPVMPFGSIEAWMHSLADSYRADDRKLSDVLRFGANEIVMLRAMVTQTAEIYAEAEREIVQLRAEYSIGDETIERGAQALFAASGSTKNTHGNWDLLDEDGRTVMRHLAAAVIRSMQL